MTKTLLQRVQSLSEDKQLEYLDNFPSLLVEEAQLGNKTKLEAYLAENYEFWETVVVLAKQRKLSATQPLLGIFDKALDAGCDQNLNYLRGALLNAAEIIEEDVHQLPAQLYERIFLISHYSSLLKSIKPTDKYWLRPLKPNDFIRNASFVTARHDSAITHLILSPDGKKSVSVCKSRTIKVYDTETTGAAHLLVSQRVLDHFKGSVMVSHPSHIQDVVITPDSQLLYSLCAGGIISVWDLNTYKELKYFELWNQTSAIEEGVSGLTMSKDGRYLYVADGIGTIHQFKTQICASTGKRMSGLGSALRQLVYGEALNVVVALDSSNNLSVVLS